MYRVLAWPSSAERERKRGKEMGVWAEGVAVLFLFYFAGRSTCGILVSWPEIQAAPPALEAHSLNHGIARDVPRCSSQQHRLDELMFESLTVRQVETPSSRGSVSKHRKSKPRRACLVGLKRPHKWEGLQLEISEKENSRFCTACVSAERCLHHGRPSSITAGFPGASGEEPACQCRGCERRGSRKIPWRTARQPTPVFLPGESHGQRSLSGLWGHRGGHDSSDLAAVFGGIFWMFWRTVH